MLPSTSCLGWSGHDYRSLVDRRWRDFIHWMRAASVYRMTLSPGLIYGGPSPRMRALANQETLSLSSLAASLGVSRTMIGADGFVAVALLAREDCDVISVVPNWY